jgi:poly(hydroxyalkanoate) granule-associated protein
MAAKKNSKKTQALPMLKESAHEIWLAGLGAFALAGEEGGKLFGQLVKKGEGLEKMNKARINNLVHRAGDLQGDAKNAVAKITTPIEAGMTNAMHRLGVPTRKEIATLTKRVEELTRVVAKSKTKGGRKARRPAKSASVTG